MAGVPEHLARTILDLVKRYLRDEYKIDLSHQVRGTLPTDYGGTGSSSGAMGPPGPTGPPGPAGPPGLAGPLDTLTDVTIASPIAGQVLRKSGGDWVNAQLAFADLGTRPTTLAGYGITDAVTLGTTQTIAGLKTFSTAPVFPVTPGSVLFAGAGGVLAEDNASLFWDAANKRLGVGLNTPAVTFHVSSDTFAVLSFDAFGASSGQRMQFRRAYGTRAAPAPVTGNGLTIGAIAAYAYGTDYQLAGVLSWITDGTPAGDDFPTRMGLFVHQAGDPPGTTTEALTIRQTGRVGIGQTVPQARLHVLETDATSTGIVPVVYIGHNSTVATAATFGSSLGFRLRSSTTNSVDMANMAVSWVDATHATRKGRLSLTVYDTLPREAIRLEANGTAPMIGLLGAPVAPRQTLPAAATDPATTMALANAIRALAITFGLGG